MKLNDDVHYVAFGTPSGEFPPKECRAAKITELPDPLSQETRCMLFVMNPKGIFFNECRYNPDTGDDGLHMPGTFHYAEECIREL